MIFQYGALEYVRGCAVGSVLSIWDVRYQHMFGIIQSSGKYLLRHCEFYQGCEFEIQ